MIILAFLCLICSWQAMAQSDAAVGSLHVGGSTPAASKSLLVDGAMTGNGVGITNQNYIPNQPTFILIGDSMTADHPLTNMWPSYLNNQPNLSNKFIKVNLAIYGDFLANDVANWDARYGHVSPNPGTTNNFVFVMKGFNDAYYSSTVGTITNALTNIWRKVRAEGSKVVAMTIVGNTGTPATQAVIADVNTAIRGMSSQWDYLVDGAARATNSSEFYPDGYHPLPVLSQAIAGLVNIALSNAVPTVHFRGVTSVGEIVAMPAPGSLYALQVGDGRLGGGAIRGPLEVRARDNQRIPSFTVVSQNGNEGLQFTHDTISQLAPGFPVFLDSEFIVNGNLTIHNFTATTATAGTATLPANPSGFLSVTNNGKLVKIPFYEP